MHVIGVIKILKIPMMDEIIIKIVRFHDLMLFIISFFTLDVHFFFFSFSSLLIMIIFLCVIAPIIVI